MKKAVIIHGTDGSPEQIWNPWLKAQLEKQGYEVWCPLMPNNHTPNRQVYNDFLLNTNWDFTDNLVVGHSSGAVSVLNLLLDERSPHINTAVLVGARSQMDGTDLSREQFKDVFPPDGFDFELIKSKVDRMVFLHGDNDPYCPLDQAKWLAEQTESKIIIIPGGGHLGRQFMEFPQLIEAINENH